MRQTAQRRSSPIESGALPTELPGDSIENITPVPKGAKRGFFKLKMTQSFNGPGTTDHVTHTIEIKQKRHPV